ncbi:hypothetical protein HETIRDRAFT_451030 [Heterobasidion irregulare TC 32-1]|uniref:Uncharacterized protein n=1 Tax=Heterobasidion irregulare (strain TC 32-1) TaxID=747525 RepID=W4KCI9_HETIT|nr:uncharacterized protein HETIRDRAFT_451030 [Heterobasidion irregulare TC 32-1]ETW83454.1 hypothetical protein HETIRDRAFT_451030 [Heterobasidion irregulare TC 32-1]
MHSPSLARTRTRVQRATPLSPSSALTLVAVAKYKPTSDVRYAGEKYVQELVDKAVQQVRLVSTCLDKSMLSCVARGPPDIRWHLIDTLHFNKTKTLTCPPSLSSPPILCNETGPALAHGDVRHLSAATAHGAAPDDLLQVNPSAYHHDMPAPASVPEREPIDGHKPAESCQLDAQNRDLATRWRPSSAPKRAARGAKAGGWCSA